MKDRVDITAIQNACSHAHYLVGIFPIRPPEIRTRRSLAHVDMNLETLLHAYFDARPELHNQRENLIKKALELEQAPCEHDE